MSLNSISYSLPAAIDDEVRSLSDDYNRAGIIERIWRRDSTVWTGRDEHKWLGWLDIAAEESTRIGEYREFRDQIARDGLDQVALLGMGGSSLCPDVLSKVFDTADFHVLDSTVPSQIKRLEDSIDPARTLFIVASKSGSTLEPNCFMQYFFERVSGLVGRAAAGKHFTAITDPGSSLEKTARELGFRHIFYGKPEIGGRFSALSAFGLAAAASMGLEVNILLSRASQMVDICRRSHPTENPGALLGLVLGVCHRRRIDKLTIFASPKLSAIGGWLEQLLAESTGKNGIAIIPVDGEPPIVSGKYSDDRLFVHIGLRGEQVADGVYKLLEDLESQSRPVVRIEVETEYHISQEFYRWEFATAVAGAVMQINPFDQPDVEAAKVEARKITDLYEQTGKLPHDVPFFRSGDISLFTDEANRRNLESITGAEPDLESFLAAHLSRIGKGDYFALLAFLDMSDENIALCTEIRRLVLELTGNATCLGFGPRFLHSTGQAYKGGPNTGVFLQITGDDEVDLPVPGQKYTFGVVKNAQAAGDLQVLLDRGRRCLRVHISGEIRRGLQTLIATLSTITSRTAGSSGAN